MADLERIAQAIENLDDNGYSKTTDFGVESYNLISVIGTEIVEQLTRIANALERKEGA